MTAISDNDTALRTPAVAGQFYPETAVSLQACVDYYLARSEHNGPTAKAVVAPHAGYIFSGPVAATAYAGWRTLADKVRRVVLLGPGHYFYQRSMAVPAARGFITPLGIVPVDQDAVARITGLPGVVIDDRPHTEEHSLEVQLPFLQTLFTDFKLVPVVVGDVDAGTIAAILEQLWGGPETRIVISTDLSHYHEYHAAREIDTATSASICALQFEALGPEQACGCMPLRGLLCYARKHGLNMTELERCNSGDTAGPRDRVVGYGAYALCE